MPFASGCFGPAQDPHAPAPNYNPAAEREDYPQPEGSDSRPSSDSSNDKQGKPGGSASIVKDFQALTPDKLREGLRENDGSSKADETGDSDAPPPPSDAPDKDQANPRDVVPPGAPE